MSYSRWYDKNPDLKDLFDFMEKFSENLKREVAQEIIQILMTEFDFDMDKEISKMSEACSYEYRRWYDYNIDMYTSFELIKKMDYETQNIAVEKISAMILRKYIEDGKNARKDS